MSNSGLRDTLPDRSVTRMLVHKILHQRGGTASKQEIAGEIGETLQISPTAMEKEHVNGVNVLLNEIHWVTGKDLGSAGEKVQGLGLVIDHHDGDVSLTAKGTWFVEQHDRFARWGLDDYREALRAYPTE
jgi:hypothetical protein